MLFFLKFLSRFTLKLYTVLAVVVLIWAASPALAQTENDRIEVELQKVMIRQAPLSEDDIRLYLANAESIYRLRFEPDKLATTITAIGGWPEERFAYATTKIAVGMSLIMQPDDDRNKAVPNFARPNPTELALIKRYQEELTRAMSQLQARYATAAGS